MVTLEEVFRKSQDNLTKSFDAEKFSSDIENLSKAETEQLLGQIQAEILKGGDYNTLTEMRNIALGNIEKARSGVYADTPENRKLGRVGQQYGGKGSRGGQQEDDETVKQKINQRKKNYFIKTMRDDGCNKDDEMFISRHEDSFKDVLKKYGWDGWDDFYESDDWDWNNDKDIKKFNKIFFECVKQIPASAFGKLYDDKHFK